MADLTKGERAADHWGHGGGHLTATNRCLDTFVSTHSGTHYCWREPGHPGVHYCCFVDRQFQWPQRCEGTWKMSVPGMTGLIEIPCEIVWEHNGPCKFIPGKYQKSELPRVSGPKMLPRKQKEIES